MNPRFYVGVDGGGSKTALCAVAEDGSSVAYANTTGASWREHGVPRVVEIVKQAVAGLTYGLGGLIGGVAMGLPCYGESAEGDGSLDRAMRGAFEGVPVYLTNDVEAGWAGSLALAPGINIVAGTGSIAFGADAGGRTARSGGWSEFFGDEGSCYWIGRRLLEIFSKQMDGRLPRDALYDTMRREPGFCDGVGFVDLIHNEYINSRERVASLQLIAYKAALAGSRAALSLYEEAAGELCLLILAVRDKLGFGGAGYDISYSGGLFKAGELVLPRLAKLVGDSGGRLLPPRFNPAQGAALLAFRHFCPEGAALAIKAFERLK